MTLGYAYLTMETKQDFPRHRPRHLHPTIPLGINYPVIYNVWGALLYLNRPFPQLSPLQISNSPVWCLASAVGLDHSVLSLSNLQNQYQAWNFFTYSQEQLQVWEAELTIPQLPDHNFCILMIRKWFPEDFNTLMLISCYQ